MAVKGERLSISAETLAVGQNFYDQPVFNPLRQLAKSHEVDVLIVYRMATIVAKRITESFRNKADGTLDYIPESFLLILKLPQ